MHNVLSLHPVSSSPNSRVLCFDFGTKRIGTAIGNSLTLTSQPLDTLYVKNDNLPWQPIIALIKLWLPDHLVVGWPINMNGEETQMCKQVQTFASRLQQKSGLSITLCDERLSTETADNIIRESANSSVNPAQYKQRDSIAAQQILNTFFEAQ